MLTRLEVDGFKNLLGFVAEFGPFTCIAGANAVGKSNLFDAIEFLSLLAEHKLNEAASKIRAVPGSSGTGRELFWTNGVEHAQTIEFAVEMIVDGLVFDELNGHPVEPSGRLLRYEIELGYENGPTRLPRLTILRERLEVIGDTSRIRFPHSESFLDAQQLRGIESRIVFDTASNEGFNEGRLPETAHAQRAVLSQPDATRDRETTIAAQKEIQSWRKIVLEPSAVAEPDDYSAPARMSAAGRHIPSVLLSIVDRKLGFFRAEPVHPITFEQEDGQSVDSALREVAMRLSALTPIRKIEVELDRNRGVYAIRVQLRSGEWVPARALSSGTLRFLAYVVLAIEGSGMYYIEEPENGIHPLRIRELFETLHEISSDVTDEFVADAGTGQDGTPRLGQVIINTHSPPFVSEVYCRRRDDILVATNVSIRRPNGTLAEALRLHPLLDTWRCNEHTRGIGPLVLAPYVGSRIDERERR